MDIFNKKFLIASNILVIFAIVILCFSLVYNDQYIYSLNYSAFIALFFTNYFVFIKKKEMNYHYQQQAAWFAVVFYLLNIIRLVVLKNTIINVNESFGSLFIFIATAQYIGLLYILTYMLESLMSNRHEYFESENLIHTFLKFFMPLLVINTVFYLIFYPGILTYDSVMQLDQALGLSQYSNHHPIMMTLLLKLATNIGNAIGLSQNGVGLYVLFQYIINCLVVSGAFTYLVIKKVSKYWFIPLFIYVFLNPVFYIYNITVWKDIPLAMSFLVFTIFNVEYLSNPKSFIQNKMYVCGFWIITLLFALWKNNAIFVVLLSFIVYIVVLKKYRKFNLIFLITIVIAYKLIIGGLVYALDVTPASSAEALSLPFQQIGGILTSEDPNVNEEDLELLEMYLDLDVVYNDYTYFISDPIKATFNAEYFKENKIDFFKAWGNLVVHNIPQAIKATILQTSSYYSIPNYYWITVSATDITSPEGEVYYTSSLLDSVEHPNALFWKGLRLQPLISSIWSIGLYFWLLLVLAYVYAKKYRTQMMLVTVPPLMLWLTILASPVNGEYRYAYPMILVSLYLLAYVCHKE